MRTTVDIDPKLLDAVVDISGEKSRNKAINKALEEYLRQRSIEDLRLLAGSVRVEDTTIRQRELDKRRHELLERIRHGRR